MSRASSTEPSSLAHLLSRSASAQHWSPGPADQQHRLQAAVPTVVEGHQACADTAAAAIHQPDENTRPGAFEIIASKPSLLAQIQAVSQKEASDTAVGSGKSLQATHQPSPAPEPKSPGKLAC